MGEIILENLFNARLKLEEVFQCVYDDCVRFSGHCKSTRKDGVACHSMAVHGADCESSRRLSPELYLMLDCVYGTVVVWHCVSLRHNRDISPCDHLHSNPIPCMYQSSKVLIDIARRQTTRLPFVRNNCKIGPGTRTPQDLKNSSGPLERNRRPVDCIMVVL